MIAAVVFDLFGTLVEIQNRQNPYRRLLLIGNQQGRAASPNDLRFIMALNGGLREAAEALEIWLSSHQLIELQDLLDLEFDSIKPFTDAVPALELLRKHEIKVAVCSNLAGPYCSIARRLFPELDGYALSAELGLLKPDYEMYQSVCEMLGVRPNELSRTNPDRVLMIGDSKRCDESGPRSFGISGHHLDRSGGGRFQDLLSFANSIVAEGSEFCSRT
ncbi:MULTISPECIES: HAD family hydrolase [Pseudomonas]|uniref:HAD family hydrolase n=1 Tax=Pseudomonas aegrilactucae TaxID=2854028 RepID=A0A9Q3ABJ6_9PSED|nr:MULTISPECIES: HAD family hydrolase [Pseudomonas]MBC3410162.1 HAD family hydrolase [Pseudomonas sp. SWRI51]MBV6287117.1 HAD family hydrolase [Pseudomonas aegrilactucae]MDD2076717.1 HAD family hydrolase [Pseudomonas putida]WRW01887.1 HAD family hydrolase [Pseudomonas putida]HDS1692668.1 HAD family hydrolase [Pseudomonas putida]